jgi:hypothetical protein
MLYLFERNSKKKKVGFVNAEDQSLGKKTRAIGKK